jgi:predicted ATP-binding protein involved in virulence
MKVKNLKLFNFKGIQYLSVDFTQTTTAFVGVNGVGKSTVLDALAIALSQLTWRLVGHAQKARPISTDDIHQDADFARIEITLELSGQTIFWAIASNRKKGVYSNPLRKSDLDQLNLATKTREGFAAHLVTEFESSKTLPASVFYDVNRAVLDIPMRVREQLKYDAHEVYQDALANGGADFKRFFVWFRNLEDSENEMRIDNPNFRDFGLEAARNAIATFTGFTDLRVRRKPKMRMTVIKNNQELNVLQLSDGERNMLALVGDMSRRLSILNQGIKNPNTGYGVVLIDEIDLHLHPAWQREVVANLEKTFPNCQFIISTHSPQVIGELHPQSVMLLSNGGLIGHALRSIGLGSSEILEELMNGKSKNVRFHEKILEIENEIAIDQFTEARKKLNSLEQQFGLLPDILRLQETLEWLNPSEKLESNDFLGDE